MGKEETNPHLNDALVAEYLKKVSPGIAREFQGLLPSQPRVSTISLEAVVHHFFNTAPSKRRLELVGIKEGPDIKRRKKKPEERESESSSGMMEISGQNEIFKFGNIFLSTSEQRRSETGSEVKKLTAEVDGLVASYLQKVTPVIARDFQSLLQSPPQMSANSLEEVVRHFSKTAPLGRELAVRIEGELAKQFAVEVVEIVLEKSTAGPVEGSSSDSSDSSSEEENSEEEVEVLLEKSIAGPVCKKDEGSSSYSSED